jgi:hypothetical protein
VLSGQATDTSAIVHAIIIIMVSSHRQEEKKPSSLPRLHSTGPTGRRDEDNDDGIGDKPSRIEARGRIGREIVAALRNNTATNKLRDGDAL